MEIIHFDTIDSTNSYASQLLNKKIEGFSDKDLHGTVITAAHQTAGRGRLGRQFYSPANTGLYMSLIYKSNQIIPERITSCAAVAVCQILDESFGIKTQIKWVNDIYLNGKKICGILTEGHLNIDKQIIDAAIIGIGINISTANFPSEIEHKAGAIFQNTSKKFENQQMLAEKIAARCIQIFDSPTKTQIALQEYKSRSFLIGKKVIVSPVIDQSKTDYEATVLDITKDAKLKVQLPDGKEILLESGEVSLKLE